MKRSCAAGALALSFVAFAVLATNGFGQTTKGQVTVGSHEYDMKVGTLYVLRVDGTGFTPRVTMQPGFLDFGGQDFKTPNRFVSYYMPIKDQKSTIYVVPELFNLKGKGPFEYEIEVKNVAVGEIMNVNAELTANDPPFKQEFGDRAHHKSYELKVKANEYYVIDMKEPAQGKLDSYLILLDNKGKTIRTDDDGGGFPNARIVYHAKEDGDLRIICTGLGEALGKFQLTVRSSEKK